jgi:hypothetical protein
MYRLSIQFTDTQGRRLSILACELGMTKTGVVRHALALLTVATRERTDGNRLAVVRDGQIIKEIAGL